MNIVTEAKGFPKELSLRYIDGDHFGFSGEDFDILELYKEILKIEEKVRLAEKRLS
jgi:hypothetical protein